MLKTIYAWRRLIKPLLILFIAAHRGCEMKIELSTWEKEFIISLFQDTHLKGITKKLIQSSTIHPDNEDYVECELTIRELEELVGELSYEANHNRKRRLAEQACEIADSLENHLWRANRAE